MLSWMAGSNFLSNADLLSPSRYFSVIIFGEAIHEGFIQREPGMYSCVEVGDGIET